MSEIRTPRGIAALLTTFCLAITPIVAAQETGQAPEPSPTTEEMMRAWMEAARPGDHHAHLARYEGRWTAEIRMWMQPGSEPRVNEAETEARLVLGGRYLEWTHAGDFDGSAFEGRQVDAYNNVDGRYESTWTDSFGTAILYYTGRCEDQGRVRVMETEFTDAMSGQTTSQRAVYTWQDDDHWTYESYMKTGDVEFKNMEIVYSRAE